MKIALAHAAIAVFAAVSLLAPPVRADEPVPAATILDAEGPVLWHAKQETAFHDAHGGEKLFPGAVVKTGVKGYAHLMWRNGGDFKLLPLSELAVPEEEGVLLNAGKVWAQFQHKLLVPFFFKSPTATAVVRGTTLGVEINPDGATTVAVLEGRVEVTGTHGEPSRMLEPGQSLTVSPFGMMGPIQPIEQHLPEFERGSQPPQGPDGMRPEGPRPEGPRPGMVFWLQQNRASERLEATRQQVRMHEMGRPAPEGQPEPPPEGGPAPGRVFLIHRRGGPDDRSRDNPHAVNPDRAFPAGRPPFRFEPPCPPPDPTQPMPTVICTPPPPPPNAPGAIAPIGPGPTP
jgi:hypothetical protein